MKKRQSPAATKLMLMAAIYAISPTESPPDIIKLGASTTRELKEWWDRESHAFARRLADTAEQQHGDNGRKFIEEMGFAEQFMWTGQGLQRRPGWD